MRLAVLSDIHGNLPALEVVAEHVADWQPDQVFVNGDVVNRGPLPLDCWQFVNTRGWTVLAGNHEEYVLSWQGRDQASPEILYQFYAGSLWTFQQLGGQVAALAQLPKALSILDHAGREIRLTHASMRSIEDGIYPETTDEELRKQIAPAPAIFLTAHTHRPLERKIEETIVINSGSVGSPFDGDVRASYIQLSRLNNGWQSRLVRLNYDRNQMREHFYTSGYLEGGGPLTRIILHEWETARPTIRRFLGRYETAVLNGEISLEEAVSEYMNHNFAAG